jgi:Ankyrin repeats (3 copies)
MSGVRIVGHSSKVNPNDEHFLEKKLMSAVKTKRLVPVQRVIGECRRSSKVVDVNYSQAGWSPLTVAVGFGLESIVAELLKCGADPNICSSRDGWSAVHWACSRSFDAILRALLQYKGDPDARTRCPKKKKPEQLTRNSKCHQLLKDARLGKIAQLGAVRFGANNSNVDVDRSENSKAQQSDEAKSKRADAVVVAAAPPFVVDGCPNRSNPHHQCVKGACERLAARAKAEADAVPLPGSVAESPVAKAKPRKKAAAAATTTPTTATQRRRRRSTSGIKKQEAADDSIVELHDFYEPRRRTSARAQWDAVEGIVAETRRHDAQEKPTKMSVQVALNMTRRELHLVRRLNDALIDYCGTLNRQYASLQRRVSVLEGERQQPQQFYSPAAVASSPIYFQQPQQMYGRSPAVVTSAAVVAPVAPVPPVFGDYGNFDDDDDFDDFDEDDDEEEEEQQSLGHVASSPFPPPPMYDDADDEFIDDDDDGDEEEHRLPAVASVDIGAAQKKLFPGRQVQQHAPPSPVQTRALGPMRQKMIDEQRAQQAKEQEIEAERQRAIVAARAEAQQQATQKKSVEPKKRSSPAAKSKGASLFDIDDLDSSLDNVLFAGNKNEKQQQQQKNDTSTNAWPSSLFDDDVDSLFGEPEIE